MRGALVALLLLVAACGPLPHPFEHPADGPGYPLAALAIDARVMPVAGLPAPTAEALARLVADNLGAYGVTASAHAGTASHFVLEGSFADPTPDAPLPHDALIVWTLRDADGEATGIHTQAVDAGLATGADAAALRDAGVAPVKALAGLIEADASLPEAAARGRKGLFLAGITGAPGDGNTALAIALRLALAGSGLGSADKAEAATSILHGVVAVGPPEGGSQPIEIRWRISGRDGKDLGEAVQRNRVPAGSLDGHWGAVAGLAARAAVGGIADILGGVGNQGAGGLDNPDRPAITVPPSPDLPAPPAKAATPSRPAAVR